MFDGMPDQFYQFLAARTATTASPSPSPSPSLSLPLSFSLHNHHHHGGAVYTPAFDATPYPLSPPPPPQPQPQQGFLSPPITHLLHHPQLAPLHIQLKNEDKEEAILPSELEQIDNTWSNDEVLALLRIRSSLDNNWFPDLITWENVSRKLGELGFKRSADKCKEKFEEETRTFNSNINASNCSSKNNITSIQNYRLFGELEDLYNTYHPQRHGDNDQEQCPPTSHPLQADDVQHELPLMLSKKNQSPSRQLDDDDGDEGEEAEEEEDKAGEGRERSGAEKNDKVVGDENSVDDSERTEENTKRATRKRKRQKKFEMFKGFCESIVNTMMAQQEQLHCKILQDMVKRDEEKIAREEAWKKQEVERIQKEMEVRAHELAIAGDRQGKILAFLNKFTSSTNFSLESQFLVEAIENLLKVQNVSSTSSIDLSQDSTSAVQPTSSCTTHGQNPSFLVTHNSPNMPTSSSNENLETSKLAPLMTSPSIDQVSQNPNENSSFKLPSIPITHKSSGLLDHKSTDALDHSTREYRSPEKQTEPKSNPNPNPNMENTKDDMGRRWPRDEVLALINIRCSLFSSTNNDGPHESKDQSSTKGIPLWERISQRMMEMGYKRSAKRCKEKWENINKYFRKTKDLNKKRSIDSRTCPYFHQLSHLYSQGQGTMLGTSDPQVNRLPPGLPEARTTPAVLGARGGSATAANGEATMTTVHGTTAQVDEGSSVVQAPALDFEF